jgi:hypothetical protein
MGDQEDGVAGPRHVPQEIEDLSLHGGVQRGGRLVGNEDAGATHDGRRDQCSLTQTAGQLARSLPGASFRVGHPSSPQGLQHSPPPALARSEPVNVEHLANFDPDGSERI